MGRRWRRGAPGPEDQRDDGSFHEFWEPDDAGAGRWPWPKEPSTGHPVFDGQPFAMAGAVAGEAGGEVVAPSPVVQALARAAEASSPSRWRRRRAARRAAAPEEAVTDGGSPEGDLPTGEVPVADAPAADQHPSGQAGAGATPEPEAEPEAEPEPAAEQEPTHVAAPGAAVPALLLPPPPVPTPGDPEPVDVGASDPSAQQRAEALLGAALSTSAAAPKLSPEGEEVTAAQDLPERRTRQRRVAAAWLTSTQAAAALILLLGAGVGFLVYKASAPTGSHPSAAPKFPPTSNAPVVTVPTTVPFVAPTTAPPTTVPATPPTTAPAPKPATAAANAVVPATPTTVPTPPQPCTAGDLAVTTTTDRSSYAAGQPVSMVTTITATRTCIFQPVPAGQYSCAASVVVKSAGGTQQWPWPGQGEVCNAPAAGTLQAGSSESVLATWNGQVQGGQDAPPGSYVVVGTWSWSSGQGQPATVVNADSPAFTVS